MKNLEILLVSNIEGGKCSLDKELMYSQPFCKLDANTYLLHIISKV